MFGVLETKNSVWILLKITSANPPGYLFPVTNLWYNHIWKLCLPHSAKLGRFKRIGSRLFVHFKYLFEGQTCRQLPSLRIRHSIWKGFYHFSKPEFCLNKTPGFKCHAFSGMDMAAESLDGPVVLPFVKPNTIENQTIRTAKLVVQGITTKSKCKS